MASYNYGKEFEQQLKKDFLRLENSSIDRLYDTQNGYKSISQICDFIGYVYPNIFYIECKSTAENTFSIAKLTQYDKMKVKVGILGVRVGVIIWFRSNDKILYVPISTITKMKQEGTKSVNARTIFDSDYNFIDVPSIKKRIFLDSDYSCLLNLEEGW